MQIVKPGSLFEPQPLTSVASLPLSVGRCGGLASVLIRISSLVARRKPPDLFQSNHPVEYPWEFFEKLLANFLGCDYLKANKRRPAMRCGRPAFERFV
jgi:hypothetical protein